jgi:predicted unusual protein kinase regulating ubiquinone biosynthesis (AarF/ABC1/UbiB family)
MRSASVSAADRLYRARRIGTTFTRVYLGAKAQRFIARRLRPPDMSARWSAFNLSSANSIYDAAVELRGLILKGCQFMGTRADVLPHEYVQVLSRLQDRVPPRPFPVVRRSVERELQCELGDVFASFSAQPLASASLAQVHEAHLHTGERVAVKVQYPEVAALVRGDLANLRFLFRAVGLVERDIDLLPLVEELATQVPRELDFLSEGRNAEIMTRHFADRDDVLVPRIHWAYTTRRVLVMEYMEGIKITDLGALEAAGIDAARVAQLLVEVYCAQVLRHGFFHADPHPGNLMVRASESGQPRLVFLDFGLAVELPGEFRQGVVDFAAALLRGDADAVARALLDLGFETRDGTPGSILEIADSLLAAAAELQGLSYLDREVVSRVGHDLAERIRQTPFVRVPSHVVLIARVLGLLSGVSRSLNSRVDLVRTLLPYAFGPVRPRRTSPQA